MPQDADLMNQDPKTPYCFGQWYDWPTEPKHQVTADEIRIIDESCRALANGDHAEALSTLFQFKPSRRESFPFLKQHLACSFDACDWECVRVVALKILGMVEFFPARFLLPIAFRHLGKPDLAEKSLALLLTKHSTNSLVLFAACYQCIANGKTEDAAGLFETAIRIILQDPRQPESERIAAAFTALDSAMTDEGLQAIRPTVARLLDDLFEPA